MFRTFNYFKNTRYITTTAVLLAVLVILALPTIFIRVGDSSFQIADGLYLALICVVPGPMMLINGILWPFFFDLAAGGLIYAPMSILIRILMFFAVKLLKRPFTNYGAIAVAGLFLFLYLPYNYAINLSISKDLAQSYVLREFIVDIIQYWLSLAIGAMLVIVFNRPKIKIIFNFSYLNLPPERNGRRRKPKDREDKQVSPFN